MSSQSNMTRGEIPAFLSQGVRILLQPAIFGSIILILLSRYTIFRKSIQIPSVGRKWWWEPKWATKSRFLNNAWSLIGDGYEKYKDSAFIIHRPDIDVIMLSNKYIDELRNLPESKLSASEAHSRDFGGKYTTMDMGIESNLHTRAIQQSMIPNIASLHQPIREELQWALEKYMEPVKENHQWHSLDMEEMVLNTVAHIAARIFVDFPLCRNDEWIQINKEFTMNVFSVALILRIVPNLFRPFQSLLVLFIPAYWRLQSNIRAAKKLIMPLAKEHLESKKYFGSQKKTGTGLIAWMVNAANTPAEHDASKIAIRALLLGIASTYTTKTALSNIFYDMCAHPQYVQELRDEVEQYLHDSGTWDKGTLDKMVKLESFMSESQRLNPPFLITFNRVAKQQITLQDGLKLPQGSQIGVPAVHIQSDPALCPRPEEFDPWRYLQHRYVTTDLHHLHFGHGKFACPGRTFALAVIKMMAAAVLLSFDMKFAEGKSRPRSVAVQEMVFPSPRTDILLRRRAFN